MSKKDKEIKVAYCTKAVSFGYILINQGACFLVKKNHLEGFHAAGTAAVQKLTLLSWEEKDHFVYYYVPEKCLVCKYNRFNEDYCWCDNYKCVVEDDD